MRKHFENITQEEYQQLKDSIAWVTLLVAGADGEIDEKEGEWASKLTKIRGYSGDKKLRGFYDEVDEDFTLKVDQLISELPSSVEERNSLLSEKIGGLNPILAKLDQEIGATLYDNLLSFAHHVAKASGGFLRMWSISAAEKKVIKLDMLEAIEHPEPEEEE